MTVTLKDEQYGTVMRALVRIARARKGPNNQRICRDELSTIAREACDVLGWKYGGVVDPLETEQ